MRAAGLLLVLATLAVAEPASPVRLATGWQVAPGEVDPERVRPSLHVGPVEDLAADLPRLLAGQAHTLEGGPLDLAAVARAAPRTAGARYLLWQTPPLTGVKALSEGLRRAPARQLLELELTRGEPAAGEPPRRWFSLWLLPASEPILLARVTVTGPAGPPRFLRYAGPLGGWDQPDRGWVEPARDMVVRMPARGFPESWRLRLEAQEKARQELLPRADETPVPFRVLAHGDHSMVSKPVRKVLRTPGELRREWGRLHHGFVPEPAEPVFAPAQELIVVVYLGEVPGPGYGVQVTGVHERPDGTLVLGTRTEIPARGTDEPAEGERHSPYVMVKVPRRAGTRLEFRPAL